MISSLFICHGAPTLVAEKNKYTNFLKDLGKKLKPKAIVVFTAHWENEVTTISAIDGTYDMIYDFYGFPRELYTKNYPAKGSLELASRIKNLFNNSGVKCDLDNIRGLDHGAWSVLYLMYPNADIPVVQVSINPFLPMDKQYEIGKALKVLGEEDILVIGSGSTVHNLSTVDWEAEEVEEWAIEFDNWLIEKVENNDIENLFNYRNLAKNSIKAVPREEHIVPMFIAMGSGNKLKPKLLHHSYAYGTLSYICFEF